MIKNLCNMSIVLLGIHSIKKILKKTQKKTDKKKKGLELRELLGTY
jgi:hypothetical protein